MDTSKATAANLRRASEEIRKASGSFCDCCGIGRIALKEAQRCVERVREIERIEAEIRGDVADE